MVSPTAKLSQAGAKQHVTKCSAQLLELQGILPAANFCQEMESPTVKFSLAGAICPE